MRVDEVTLFRSHLGRGPARYEVVDRYPLAR
jgi:2'-5' RNA ligase